MFSLLDKLFEIYTVNRTMEMQFTLKLSGYDVSSGFYGAKFLRVLITPLPELFLQMAKTGFSYCKLIFTKFYTTCLRINDMKHMFNTEM